MGSGAVKVMRQMVVLINTRVRRSAGYRGTVSSFLLLSVPRELEFRRSSYTHLYSSPYNPGSPRIHISILPPYNPGNPCIYIFIPYYNLNSPHIHISIPLFHPTPPIPHPSHPQSKLQSHTGRLPETPSAGTSSSPLVGTRVREFSSKPRCKKLFWPRRGIRRMGFLVGAARVPRGNRVDGRY